VTLEVNESLSTATITNREKERIKAEARARILATLTEYVRSDAGSNPVIVPSTRVLRELLGMEDMRKELFDSSLWHLDAGTRDPEGKRRVRVSRRGVDGRRLPLQVTVMGEPLRASPEIDEHPGLVPEY